MLIAPHHVRFGLLAFVAGVCLLALACGDSPNSVGDAAVADANVPPDAAPDAAVAPSLRNPVALPDAELAVAALKLLGSQDVGGSKNCNACHGLTRQNLSHWRALTDTSLSDCLVDLDVSTPAVAKRMLDCLRSDPTMDTTPFDAHKLGIYASAARLDWFKYTFEKAYGAADWQDEFDGFTSRVAMPKGIGQPFTQDQLDIVAEWFSRGLPALDATLPRDPPPTNCDPGVSAVVTDHVAAMATTGWRAVNKENGILMYGCGDATTPIDCLSELPRAGDTTYGVGWESMPGAKLRVLRTNDFSSSFWTRSSADGRFVGSGSTDGNFTSFIVDLAEDKVIPTTAFYDPAFFPDNSGFVFQGNRAYMCNQKLLTMTPASIDYREPDCASTRWIGLYEHVAAGLGGNDYWAVDGQFVSDNGGKSPTLGDPRASFSSRAEASFTPMVHTGTVYEAGASENVRTPFEGDTVILPSAQMIMSRVSGPNELQLGYVMRKLDITATAGGFDIELPEVARYCVNGSKPGFSLDERWMVMQHYVIDSDAVELGFADENDPGFAAYRTSGASNIYLIDLLTGQTIRVTNMNPGQYALFPHFRSDGWIYFIVRNVDGPEEHIMASDAALVLENAP